MKVNECEDLFESAYINTEFKRVDFVTVKKKVNYMNAHLIIDYIYRK